ncbi:MAG: ABC transporter permease subunit [Acidimicrobiia bacterium]
MADSKDTSQQSPLDPMPLEPKRGFKRTIFFVLAMVFGVIVYAYGFDVTNVNLDEIKSETRQAQLVRVLRSLARPDLMTYERVSTPTDTAFAMPCPAGGFTPTEPDANARHITVEPACVETGGKLTVRGSNFSPNARGTLVQVPPSGDLELRLADFQVDGNGDFELVVNTRERASDQQQTIRAITRENIGTIFNPVKVEVTSDTGLVSTVTSPRISKSTTDTWERIVETVFLAFLATTLGTIIAVPLSFMAARNLMKDISIPMTKLALQLLAMPVGVGVGILAAGWARTISELLTHSVLLVILGLVFIPFLMVLAFRWALPPVEDVPPTPGERSLRALVISIASVGGIVVMFLLASLMVTVGNWLAPRLASVDFLGSFVASLGDILNAIITLLTALATAGVLMNLAGKLGMWMKGHLPAGFIKVFRMPLAAAAGAVLAVLIGIGIGWLYQITDPLKIYWIPAAVGAAIGLALAIRAYQKEQVGIGLSIYYIARTIFNAIRSIEPLVMVIVFVVWVGLGPFAGSLALALHTVAALAKLYSEQVESIQTGPIEAVKASGATRIQTIVYAVIPQIVPPYISFTLYRWDINVRMSTIIGFAGGGGIGFLLQQNIRLLNYRAASVNMLAIAIVVASMDYLSSRIRERIV